MKPLRFLPLVALATSSLLVLKIAGLMFDGRGALTGTQVSLASGAATKPADQAGGSKNGETAKTPTTEGQGEDKERATAPIDNGHAPQASGEHAAPAGGHGEKKATAPALPPKDMAGLLESEHRTKSEIALLQSLAKRRDDIDRREKEIDLRANLLKAAEQRVEERIGALKVLHGKIESSAKQEVEQRSEQYKQLVSMYSNMKPKDAARIFDELDKDILLGLMKEMKTQTVSAIFAAMNPAKSRELTILIANEAKGKQLDVAETMPLKENELKPFGGQ